MTDRSLSAVPEDDIDLEFELAQLQCGRPPNTSLATTELYPGPSSFSSSSSSTCDAQSFDLHLPLPPRFVDATLAPSSSSSPPLHSSPISSPPSSPEPHRQLCHLPAVETSTKYRVYYFSHMPEKGRTIWVVLFCRRVHSLAGFTLRLYTSGPAGVRQLAHTLRANTNLSWTTVCTANDKEDSEEEDGEDNDDDDAEGVHQYKVAFDCPNDTFAGRVFGAELIATSCSDHFRGDGQVIGVIDLGVMKVVSTTSVRKRHYAQLERLSPSRAHDRLLANFKQHHTKTNGTASKRHHANGKGVRQRSRRGLPFLIDEYRQAVELSIACGPT